MALINDTLLIVAIQAHASKLHLRFLVAISLLSTAVGVVVDDLID